MANISVHAACTRPAAICSRTEAYRDRNGNAQIWCLAIDMLRFPYLFLLVGETRVSVLKIRTVSVRVRPGRTEQKLTSGCISGLASRLFRHLLAAPDSVTAVR